MSERTDSHKAPYNTQPAGLEKWLDEQNGKLPFPLPPAGKKWLGANAWWIVLIGGLLTAWGVLGFWQAAHYVSDLERVIRSYGGNSDVGSLSTMWYVSLAAMVVSAVLLLGAVSPLKNHRKQGWNLVFYSTLVSLALGIFYLFVDGYGFGSLVGYLIGALIGWYFLFQTRSQFNK
jgi:hypothetical protein